MNVYVLYKIEWSVHSMNFNCTINNEDKQGNIQYKGMLSKKIVSRHKKWRGLGGGGEILNHPDSITENVW